mmetsp:Transcript_71408/g.165127  ORF Transcript_71408/g.165127 Transcript_71408/m.165127 type:complete len:260 (-) Transcript_71408:1261-2040(-)
MDGIGRLKLQVLHSQRTTTHSVSLLLRVLFATNPQCQLVNEVCCRCFLPFHDALARLKLLVALTNVSNTCKKTPRTVVLEHVRLPFEPTGRCEAYILRLSQKAVLKGRNPLHSVLVYYIFVSMPGHADKLWHAGILRNVDHHTLWESPLLQQALLRVFTSTTEQLWRLKLERTQLLPYPIDERVGKPSSLTNSLLLQRLLLSDRGRQTLDLLLLGIAGGDCRLHLAVAEALCGRLRRGLSLQPLDDVLDDRPDLHEVVL